MSNKNQYITGAELAGMLGVTRIAVYYWTKRKKNPCPHVLIPQKKGSVRMVLRYNLEQVKLWIKEERRKAIVEMR